MSVSVHTSDRYMRSRYVFNNHIFPSLRFSSRATESCCCCCCFCHSASAFNNFSLVPSMASLWDRSYFLPLVRSRSFSLFENIHTHLDTHICEWNMYAIRQLLCCIQPWNLFARTTAKTKQNKLKSTKMEINPTCVIYVLCWKYNAGLD